MERAKSKCTSMSKRNWWPYICYISTIHD